MAKKGKVLQTIIDISGEISPTLGKTIDSVVDRLDGINGASLAASAAIAGIGVGAAAGLKSATKYMTKLGDEWNTALGDMSAQTGFVGEDLEALAESAKAIYAMNLGESLGDVTDTISDVQRQTGLWGDALQGVSADAIMLRDTFEYDVNESTRAAKALMDNFNISGHDAMNMIATGAQNGLDWSGELLDTITEYSPQFKKLGLDADDMFNIMQSGADGAAFNLDKVGDTVKEFSIRAIDGSKSTIEGFEAIGMNADEMMQIFAAGGEEASDAFYAVLQGLLNIEDPVARDAAGVQLMGTMWEDMGLEAIQALADTQDGAYATSDALEQIGDVKYNNLGTALEGIRRKIDVGLLPASEALTQSLVDAAPEIGAMVDQASPHLEALAGKIGPLVTGAVSFAVDGLGLIADNMDTLIPIAGGLTGALVAYKLATIASAGVTKILTGAHAVQAAAMASGTAMTTAQAAATWALNGAMAVLTSPIFLVVAAIGVLIAAGVALYRHWDTVKAYAAQLGSYVSGVWTNLKNGAINLKNGIVEAFTTGFQSLVGIVKAPVNAVVGIINGAIEGINSIGFTVPDWVPFIGGKAFQLSIPMMPYFASGGFTNGMSIAGEDGQEAVISFKRQYRKDNLSYWAKAGRMLGATPEDADFGLSGTGNHTAVDIGGITFAPNITITGNADKRSIIQAIRDEYPEFLDMLDEYFMERGVPVYG